MAVQILLWLMYALFAGMLYEMWSEHRAWCALMDRAIELIEKQQKQIQELNEKATP